MKNAIYWLSLTMLLTCATSAYAASAGQDTQPQQSTPNQDTSVVDLSDVDTDQPVQSPSFENTTPAGQAPGGPINS